MKKLIPKIKGSSGDKFRFAKAEEVEEITGYSPGGMSFAIKTEIPIIIDKSLERFPVVYAAAGTSGSAVPITVKQLLEITQGEYLSVC